ncbi:MAG: MFS transporter [Alphaproteobacteria bacterium]|nr:MFS transporter [Alphaproteobacteria bacterium]
MKSSSVPGQSRLDLKAVFFGSLASAFEWYDYALFGYFAAIIGKLFFPSEDPLTSLLSSFAVFASGFAMRPLGAIWFGYIGDRMGRSKALTISLVMMAVPTTLLGLLPTYDRIGIWASFGLVFMRLLQGFAVGGNYGGSFIFTIEHAPSHQKGLAGSLAMFGTLGGLFMGSGVAALLGNLLTPETLHSIGWRIPFLFGSLSAVLGYVINKRIPESQWQNKTERNHRQLPVQNVWNNYRLAVIKCIGIVLLDGIGVYILFVFMTTYATVFLHLSESKVLLVNTACMLSLVVMIPAFGWLGDRISQRTLLKWVSMCFILFSIPLFSLLVYKPCMRTLLLLQASFAIVVSGAYGALPAAVVNSFPRSVRYTACGLAFNISVAVFGGTSPFIVTGLIHLTGSLMVPAIVLTIVGGISFLSAHTMRRSYLNE